MVSHNLSSLIPTQQSGQTHSNNSSAVADELFECVRPFCGVAALRVKFILYDWIDVWLFDLTWFDACEDDKFVTYICGEIIHFRMNVE